MLLQGGDRQVSPVGESTFELPPAGSVKFPVFAATLRIGNEILKDHFPGIEAVPNAPRAAEIGNPGFCADTGTGKNHDTVDVVIRGLVMLVTMLHDFLEELGLNTEFFMAK